MFQKHISTNSIWLVFNILYSKIAICETDMKVMQSSEFKMDFYQGSNS